MKILVQSLVKNKRLTKKTNGNNIFKTMKSSLNKNPNLREFILDMQGISIVNEVVFSEIKYQMQSNLNGDFILKLENSNPLINQIFNVVFAN